ncbi:MAG: alpha/beta fold hydrolase, partial [Acidimicrobiia bacterium]
MAHGPSRRILAVLIALLLGGCSGGEIAGTTLTSTTVRPAPTTSPPLTTTSTVPGTTTTGAGPSTTTGSSIDIDAEVQVPDGEGPFPAVVLVHGGGWVAGGPSVMRPLANHLLDNGFLTVNTRYRLATRDHPGFPEAIDDLACAVRYAAAHPASDGSVAVVGHSAGAHLGAIVALTGDEYGQDCAVPGTALPERFVGLAGPYDVSRLGMAMTAFFGAGPSTAPEAWRRGNPQLLTEQNPGLEALIMYG